MSFPYPYALVTLAQAKQHLQMDHDLDDALIESKVEQASGMVLDYLKLPSPPSEWNPDSAAESPGLGVPPLIQSAVLLAVGELYKNRDAGAVNVLSEGVRSLLHRQRDPSMA